MAYYRLIRRVLGNWEDVTENGEAFNWESENDIKRLLEECNHHNWKGDLLSYRKLTDSEAKEIDDYILYRENLEAQMRKEHKKRMIKRIEGRHDNASNSVLQLDSF